MIKINVHITKNKQKKIESISIPASTKIFQLKRLIHKLSKISISAMRLILGARILKDEYIIGDYILSLAKGRHKKYTKDYNLFVSHMFDLSKEVDIFFKLFTGDIFKSHFQIIAPISHLRDLLWDKIRMPKTLGTYFSIKKLNFTVRLEENRSLLDYGIDGSNSIEIFVLPYDDSIIDFDNIGKIIDSNSGLKLQAIDHKDDIKSSCSVNKEEKNKIDKKSKKSTGLFNNFKKGFLNDLTKNNKKSN
jgi:hypothetical protein